MSEVFVLDANGEELGSFDVDGGSEVRLTNGKISVSLTALPDEKKEEEEEEEEEE